MAYEVDFTTVGDGERSGDAIALRFGDLSRGGDAQKVVVIDGGNKDSGAALVNHIRKYYQTNRVDLAVNTHPDGDHASGLTEVFENMDVGRLWMHRPWNHVEAGLFKDGRLTDESLEGRLREELEQAHEIDRLAEQLGIPVEEPFSGLMFHGSAGWLGVLGPDEDYYEELLLDFRSTPEKKAAAAAQYGRGGVMEALQAGIRLAKKILENWGYETLEDPDEDATTAENNSSAILLLKCDGRYSLFTGDAGVPALERAIALANLSNIDLTVCHLHQIPHHGSRRNVGPTLLNRLVGPRVLQGASPTKSAIVSAAVKGEPKHPAKKVTNAYQRRGCTVTATQGNTICHSHNAPRRVGWSAATSVPFYFEVDG